jgi:hypothetical protein
MKRFILLLLCLVTTHPVLAQRAGEVRFINLTRYPVRLIAASQRAQYKSFYWEFNPTDLFLSLQVKNTPLILQEGDVLAAFALNASSVSWGPFIVGHPPLTWDEEQKAWSLLLTKKTVPGTFTSTQPILDASQLGSLRVGNSTDAPLRVSLTKRDGSVKAANWDFAPRKASREGLPLTLGRGALQVEPGDVLFIYATDGSRRFWGPDIVGQSPAPFWDNKYRFWSTLLRP